MEATPPTGRIYFSPDDQEYLVYHPQIQQVITNGGGWVAQPGQFCEAAGWPRPSGK